VGQFVALAMWLSSTASEQPILTPRKIPMRTTTQRAVLRRLVLCAAISAALSVASAQTAPAKPDAKEKPKDGDAVVLSPFEVVMTQDKGYNVTNSGMALRTSEEIMQIPQSISVITRDMIADMATENISDFVNYSGGSNFFQGDSAMLRGVRVSMYADGVPDYNFDPVTTDSITVVRGPVGVLYGVGVVGNLGGAILKNTRVPTGRNGGSVVMRADQWGFLRGELDYSGVIGQVGDAKFSYRVDLMHQKGKFYWDGLSDDRDVAYLVAEMKRPANTLRINYTYSDRTADPHRNFFVTPEGLPYRGPNPKESYMPPNSKLLRRDRTLRVLFNQHLGGNWNLALRAAYSRNYYNQGVVLANAINWQTNEVVYLARNNNLGQRLFSGSADFSGDYTLFGLKQKTSGGFLGQNNSNKPNAFPADPTFAALNVARGIGRAVTGAGFTGGGTQLLAVPVDDPRTADIFVRQSEYYFNPAVSGVNYGSRQENVSTNVYLQQNVEVIRNRLTLVGSLSQYNQFQESTNRPFVAPASITGTITRAADLLHRVGFVFMITKDLGIYGLESESITPQSARLFDGSFAEPQQGVGRELGFKTNFLDGRISATVGVFDIELSNVAINSGLISPISGLTYFNLIGSTTQRGADITLFVKPTPNWQVTFNAYKGKVEDQRGLSGIPNTFEGSWSVYTRYQFTSEALKKFAIGGGSNRAHNRYITGSSMRLRDGSPPPSNGTPGVASSFLIKDGTMTQMFIDYNPSRKWSVKLHVNNLFDEFFVVGHQHAAAIDPTAPRTTQIVATYRF
jgi:iron complex outermembrane recepter protein